MSQGFLVTQHTHPVAEDGHMSDSPEGLYPEDSTTKAGPTSGRLRLLLLTSGVEDAEGAQALLETALPHADISVVSTPEQTLSQMRSRTFDAFVEQLPAEATRGLFGTEELTPETRSQPVLALTNSGEADAALWSLTHYPDTEEPESSQESLGDALRQAVDAAARGNETAQTSPPPGVLDALEAATCAVDAHGRILFRNTTWQAFAAANGGEELHGDEDSYLQVCDAAARGVNTVSLTNLDALDGTSVGHGLRAVLGGDSPRFEYEYPCHSPQEERWFSVRITPWKLPGGATGAVIVHLDVTLAHQAQAALSHQALHDDLTGLPNRTLLRDRLRQALHDSTRRGTLVGVGFIGLDFFKRINSSLGHSAGDALLMDVGWRLSKQLRPGDTLARFGGDEFVVIWRDLDTEHQGHQLAEAMSAGLTVPFTIDESPVVISASIGVATSTSLHTGEELIQAADMAMYQAKRRGRDRVSTVAHDVPAAEQQERQRETELRVAIAAEQLVLHYQPVIELASGTVVGVEALVRWEHPTRGLLAPHHFIPVAENSGLIGDLGKWTLEQACTDAAQAEGSAQGLHMAVNLSVRQLINHEIVSHVRSALDRSGLAPHRLVLEVTESSIMQDEDVAALVLEELHALGVQLAIDDFGTGFSSLLYLRRYPIGAIKIDRAFVGALPASADDHAICASIVSLANAVRAVSIGEGVETREQYEALRSMGCTFGQGFLWSRGVPLGELEDALAACSRVPQPRAVRTEPRREPAVVLDPAVLDRIRFLQRAGASLHTVAAALNAEGTLTARGMRWTATAVARHLHA